MKPKKIPKQMYDGYWYSVNSDIKFFCCDCGLGHHFYFKAKKYPKDDKDTVRIYMKARRLTYRDKRKRP